MGKRGQTMTDDFEDHCWKDVIPPEDLQTYECYRRQTFIGPNAAFVAIDLYDEVYRGGTRPPHEVAATYPNSCGMYAHAAIAPTQRLFSAVRAAGLPVFYSAGETRAETRPTFVAATRRQKRAFDPTGYAIRPEFKPQPGDVIITKQRASAFFGTPLTAHLTQLGIRTVIMCGETTSGCVRASAVDAYSHGFHVVLVEECCFDRSLITHKINLFDMHHKYADVMHLDQVIAHLETLAVKKAS
jgi:nicotinamidase-related amidase